MRASFVHSKGPMVVGVIKERTPDDAICRIREGEYAGARGFDLHIAQLDEEYRNTASLRRIIDSTDRPILSMNYNNGYDGMLDLSDEQRMETLIYAAEAGTAAVDIQGYTFDRAAKEGFTDDELITPDLEFLKQKRPREITLKPEAARRQRELAERMHGMGAEVLGSVHLGTVLSKEELTRVALLVRSRGFDMVKMVAPCTDKHQIPGAIESMLHLSDTLDFPFSYHMSGRAGIVTRQIGPLFGSYIVFANVSYGKNSDTEQLHLRSIIDTYRSLGIL